MPEPLLLPHEGLRPKTEGEVERECDDFALRQGWTVESYSVKKRSLFRDMPDRRYVHLPSGWRVWVELKRPGGKLTLGQHTWIMHELAAGGLALPVDDVTVLRALHEKWKKLYGREDAIAYCTQVTKLTAQRGYRKT